MAWKAVAYYVTEFGACPGAIEVSNIDPSSSLSAYLAAHLYDGVWSISAMSEQDFATKEEAEAWAEINDYDNPDLFPHTGWKVLG